MTLIELVLLYCMIGVVFFSLYPGKQRPEKVYAVMVLWPFIGVIVAAGVSATMFGETMKIWVKNND